MFATGIVLVLLEVGWTLVCVGVVLRARAQRRRAERRRRRAQGEDSAYVWRVDEPGASG